MAAEGWPALLMAVLSLGLFAQPCDPQELRCRCAKMVSEMIPLKCIKNIQVIPQTIYCSRDEVIAILKYGDIICLDPKAKWVEALIKKIIYRFLTDDHQGMGHPTEMKSLHLFKFEYSLEENPFV